MSRWVLLGLVVLAVVALPVGLTALSVSRGHRVSQYQIRYDTFPESDRPLADWLRAQPGVAKVEARHDAAWLYLAVHTYKRYPSPDVFAACARFGYEGQGGSRASVVRPLW